MNITELIENLKGELELKEKLEQENKNLKFSRDFYKSRCELLGKVQKYMRDPERTIVCDILANDTLLPDPKGKRYGQDLRPLVVPSFFPKDLENVIDSITTEYDGKEGAFRALDRLYDENKKALSNLDDDAYDTPIVMEDEE